MHELIATTDVCFVVGIFNSSFKYIFGRTYTLRDTLSRVVNSFRNQYGIWPELHMSYALLQLAYKIIKSGPNDVFFRVFCNIAP